MHNLNLVLEMTTVKYIFNDSLSSDPVEQENRRYWFEKLQMYLSALTNRRNNAQYEGDIEAMTRCNGILKQVHILLEKCSQSAVIYVTVKADDVTVFDMQKTVAMIQNETGLVEMD